jgi:NADPH:quinone reductase-like Zn-dependent oxidoreductase
MARTVRLHRFGGPEVLQLDEVAIGAPGVGEVRMRVAAIGLNRIEAVFRAGHFMPAEFPTRIGYEAAGTIEAVGPGVAGYACGDRVAALFGLPMDRYGTYAEAILYRADHLVKVMEPVSLIDAAASWMQYGTAYALVEVAGVRAGDFVVITAASSSVGLAAIQLANCENAIPIAVTRSRSKAAALRAAGAAHVIVSEHEGAAARVREITGGAGARILFDAVAGPALPALIPAVAPGGIIIAYGFLAGTSCELPLPLLMQNNITLRGFAANSLIEQSAVRARMIDYINRGLVSGALRPVIARTFTLAQIAAAHRYLVSNAQLGKIVVVTDRSIASSRDTIIPSRT